MKTHSNAFKNAIKGLNEIDSVITYTQAGVSKTLGMEELNEIIPTFQGNILKSVMKELDIDSNVDIPIGTEVNYKFGVKVDGSFEYLNFGNYIVYSSEKQEDLDSYKIICYDKMLYAMKQNEDLGVTYPITIRNYMQALCNKLGLGFKSSSATFANYNKKVTKELFVGTTYTYRDILDQLAQVTASTICLDSNDNLEVRYINDTNDIIDEEYLKDINVDFGQKYGPINSIVLSRAGVDNVYKRDEASVTANGLCEIKIVDNQFMNYDDRSEYLDAILAKLDGLEYYLNDFSSYGIAYLELCDRYNIQVGDNNYSCIMFNDEMVVTQGLEENIYTDLAEESETDYTKADKTDSKINGVTLIVDKQAATIEAQATKITDLEDKTATLRLDVDRIEGEISDIADVTVTSDGTGTVTLLNVADESEPIYIRVKPTIKNLSLIYPRSNLYPSSDLYPVERYLLFKSGDYEVRYRLPADLWYYNSTTYDEFILDYENTRCYVIHRVDVNADGTTYALDEQTEEDFDYPTISLQQGDYEISLEGHETAYIYARLLANNIYTNQFATKVELNSKITQTASDINLKVDQIASELETEVETLSGEVDVQAGQVVLKADANGNIVKAELTADPSKGTAFNVKADNINFEGKSFNLTTEDMSITSNNFSVDSSGNMTCNNANINGILEKTTSLGTVKVGKGDAGLMEMEATQNGVTYKSRYNVAGMRYFIDGNEKIKITALNNGSISLKDNSGNDLAVLDTANGGYLTLNNKSNATTIDLIGQTGKIICVSLTQTSLAKNKKNFEKYGGALSEINKIDIYKYNLKSEEDGAKKHLGFVIGDGYNYSKLITSEKNDGVDNYSMTSLCLQAIKEQQALIEKLQERIDILEERISDKNE